MDPQSSAKVADAALQLVQAVTGSVGASQLSLQNTTNQHLSDVKTTLATLVETDVKSVLKAIEELGIKTASLQKAIEEEGKAVREEAKMRRIEFALQNTALVANTLSSLWCATEISTPSYHHSDKYTCTKSDANVVLKSILFAFRRGLGSYITNFYIDPTQRYSDGDYQSASVNQDYCKVFRDKLVVALHILLGKKPALHTETTGLVAVRYE